MAAPEFYGLSKRAGELLRLKKENDGGMYDEYCPWLNACRLNAMLATTGESDGYARGGAVTAHILSNAPVSIEPTDLFATYGMKRHTREETDAARDKLGGLPYGSATFGHIALDYRRLITRGIGGIIEEIDGKLADLAEGENKKTFYESAKVSLEAVLYYAGRFREKALKLAKGEKGAGRKSELMRIANALENVPLRPADTFFEALQSILIFHFAARILTPEPNSLGRLDYILGGYYERDLARGLVTREEAAEWLQMIRIKSSIMTGQSDSIIIAGSGPEGEPFWNDLTYFILDASNGLNLQGPQIWFRYAEGQPRSLLTRALAPIREGSAQPGFFNDGTAVPALMRAGVSRAHALDYVCCQCIELTSQGRSNVLSGYGYYSLAKPVEILMNGGHEIVKDGSHFAWPAAEIPANVNLDFKRFSDFQDSYEAYLRSLLRSVVSSTNEMLKNRPEIRFTLSSALLEGCLESGVSANGGGAVYNFSSPNFTGLITAADSLAAIRQCVYEEKMLSLNELSGICAANFTGFETERQYLLNRCPKYGNDDNRADSLAGWILGIVDDELGRHVNVFGEKIVPQYMGWSVIDALSYTLSATPDGRRHGETPSGTLGGDLGRERGGMTALFNSVTSLDHTKAPGGLNVNLRVSRSTLAKEEDLTKMADLLTTYFQNGGMEVQINCVSREKLADAQKNPGMYRDLCVRVTGQSLYFVDLGKALQDQIINRVEHTS